MTSAGWKVVIKLEKGEEVKSFDGRKLMVFSVVDKGLRSRTYNFEVADSHTYFVGTGGARVHNAGPCSVLTAANKPFNPQGISHAARAFEKHGGRGVFPTLTGNVAQKNQAASNFVLEVLGNPGTTTLTLGRGGTSYRLPDGRGFVIEPTGKFNLLDPSLNIP